MDYFTSDLFTITLGLMIGLGLCAVLARVFGAWEQSVQADITAVLDWAAHETEKERAAEEDPKPTPESPCPWCGCPGDL